MNIENKAISRFDHTPAALPKLDYLDCDDCDELILDWDLPFTNVEWRDRDWDLPFTNVEWRNRGPDRLSQYDMMASDFILQCRCGEYVPPSVIRNMLYAMKELHWAMEEAETLGEAIASYWRRRPEQLKVIGYIIDAGLTDLLFREPECFAEFRSVINKVVHCDNALGFGYEIVL
jgi:hypothetical protein